MSKSNRVTKVQTPGAPNPPADNPLSDPPGGAQEAAQATSTKTAATAPTGTMQDRPNRQQYAEMRADDIDPTTLTTAVLSKDGWVCPVAPALAK